jgi:hypothetical protein
MAFPVTPLQVRVRIAPGSDPAADPATWTLLDVTNYVRVADGIDIEVGEADEGKHVDAGKCTMTFDNSDGRFCRTNPLGPYFGSLDVNTPIQVDVNVSGVWYNRFTGTVPEWPPRWDKSRKDVTVPITAAGVIRRLRQGDAPLRSPLYRATVAQAPLAHWTFEDGTDTTAASSAVSGVGPLAITTGTVKFGVDGPAGANKAADMTNGFLRGILPNGTNPNGWAVHFALRATTPAPGNVIVQPVVGWTTQDGSQWGVLITDDGVAPSITAYDNGTNGTLFDGSTSLDINPYDGNWHSILFMVTKLTSTTQQFDLYVDGVYHHTGTGSEVFSPLGGSVNFPGQINFLATDALQISHLGFFETTTAPLQLATATTGYAGELAADRVIRLCDEFGIEVTATAGVGEPLGPQQIDKFLDVLRQAEDADRGILYEATSGFGYVAREQLYNQASSGTFNMDTGDIAEPPEPTDDDQALMNDVTCTRIDGGSARYEETTGPRRIAKVGRYDQQFTLNVQTDGVLYDHATWRAHLGTVDDLRWPRLEWDLSARPALIPTWLALAIGDRFQAATPPGQVAPDPVDVLLLGYHEHLSAYEWHVVANATPAAPWYVMVCDTDRVDTSGSTLAAAITTTAQTSLSVASTNGLWSHADGDFDVAIGGERMTVTNVTGSSSPQTFTVTRHVNGVQKTHASGATVELWRPPVVAL